MHVLALFAVVALASAATLHLDPEFQFNLFLSQFNKSYSTTVEHHFRLNIFKQNLATIEQLNAEEPFAPFGITQFTDLTTEEFQAAFLMPKGRPVNQNRDAVEEALIADVDVPSAFDWRDTNNSVTAVKNQGQCGSCWAFSATENIESVWAIQGNHSIISLAPQQIVDCDTVDQGCNGGDTPTAYQYVEKAGGLETEKDYPYTARDGKCKAVKSKEVASFTGFEYATKSKNETAMLVYTATTGVLTKNCGNSLDHCVQLVGYGTDAGTNYWSVRNSWGVSWGEVGYIRVERDKNLCGIADEPTSTYIR